eukprot:1148510-Pelagomonas_calceolata.AAC.3
MATGRKQEAQGEELDTGGFSTRTRGGSRSNERGPGAASDSRQLDAQGQSFVVEGDDTQAAGDYWLQWAGDLDPNDGHQRHISTFWLARTCHPCICLAVCKFVISLYPRWLITSAFI